jgi:hypothetical protein
VQNPRECGILSELARQREANSVINLLVAVIVLGLIVYICRAIGLPEPFDKIVLAVCCVILIVVLLDAVGVLNVPLR